MMMLDYKGGGTVKYLGKSDYVICECSLRLKNVRTVFQNKLNFKCQCKKTKTELKNLTQRHILPGK